jgi:hypothetical protein
VQGLALDQRHLNPCRNRNRKDLRQVSSIPVLGDGRKGMDTPSESESESNVSRDGSPQIPTYIREFAAATRSHPVADQACGGGWLWLIQWLNLCLRCLVSSSTVAAPRCPRHPEIEFDSSGWLPIQNSKIFPQFLRNRMGAHTQDGFPFVGQGI